MSTPHLLPAVIVPIVLWRVYRRIRRNIGRQPFKPWRMIVMISVVTLFLAGVITASVLRTGGLPAILGGVVLGCGLGGLGVHLVQFRAYQGRIHYTPNPYLGVSISLLLIGRMLYRLAVILPHLQRGQPPPPLSMSSRFTAGLIGLVLGYYLVFGAGVWWRGQRMAARLRTEEGAAA